VNLLAELNDQRNIELPTIDGLANDSPVTMVRDMTNRCNCTCRFIDSNSACPGSNNFFAAKRWR
jgi:hypothetical protein